MKPNRKNNWNIRGEGSMEEKTELEKENILKREMKERNEREKWKREMKERNEREKWKKER
jgi:hypothetical protein